jgi:Outer membrane protein beta-barrel domain
MEFLDKNTEDLGWTQMSALLDREMPVAKRRRRFMWLWWLVGAGVLMSGVFLYKKTTTKMPITPVTVVQQPIVSTTPNLKKEKETKPSVSVNTPKIESNKTTQISDNQQLTTNYNPPKNSLQVTETALTQPSKPNLLHNVSFKTTNELSSTVGVTQNHADNLPPMNQNEAKNTEGGKNLEFPMPDSTTTADISERKSDILNPLPLGHAVLLDIKQAKLDNFPTNTLLMPSKIRKWHWGVAVGVNTEGGGKLSSRLNFVDRTSTANAFASSNPQSRLSYGFTLGLMAKRQLTTRWDVRMGLNYSFMDLGTPSFAYWQVDKTAYDATLIDTTRVLKQLKSDSWQLTQLHYLDNIVSGHYRFAKKWSVGLGVKTSYLVHSQSNLVRSSAGTYVFSNNSTGLGTSISQADPKSANVKTERFDAVSRTSIGDLQVQKWDFATTGSVHFSPRRWDISLRYDLGTLNVLKRQNARDFNRYVGLNVVYWLK